MTALGSAIPEPVLWHHEKRGILKILHVIDGVGVGGGAEESLVGMLPRLRERGIQGDIICLYDRKGHEHALRQSGFTVTVLGKRSRLSQAMAIRRAIRSSQPDLVHASLIDACLATRLAMVGMRTPQLNSLVNTTYDPVRQSHLKIAKWKMTLLKGVDRLTSGWVRPGFHALTQAVKREAVEILGIPESKVWIIPRGRDTVSMGDPTPERRQMTRESLGVAEDQLIILNVGRQDPQKAKTLLVEAFGLMAPAHPEAILLIAGREGNDTENLFAAVRSSEVADRIHILGHRTDIPDLLSAADMFVFPSHYEGLGGALVEALCMKCPTIGSDAPAIAEVLGHGEYGLVVPRGDAQALSSAMSSLAVSANARSTLALKGREHFERTFELDTVINQMANLYKFLVEKRAHPTLLRRVIRRMRRAAEMLTNRLLLLESAPASNRHAGALPTEGLTVTVCNGLEDYESVLAEFASRPNPFAAKRFMRGCSYICLTHADKLVSWSWISPPGRRFHVLEIGRSIPLAENQRVVFDVETEEAHRGRGYAEAVVRAIQASFAQNTLLAYVLTDNLPSLRVFEKCSFQIIGELRWKPPLRFFRKLVSRG